MSTTSKQPSPSNQKAATTTPPPETPGAGRELTPAEERELQARLDAEDEDAEVEGFNPTRNQNTNSQEIAQEEREKMMRERGLSKPAENAPLGLKELFHILTVMSKDTPDSHTLFGMMGQRFTVGGMRSLFPGVKKTPRE